jgi:hypothetical protein
MTLPVCSECGLISVLNLCRRCATPKERAGYPDEPDDLVGLESSNQEAEE